MIVRIDIKQREKIIKANWMFEDHDSDWDGIPNYKDSSPLGVPIRRGYGGGTIEGMDFDPVFHRVRRRL